MKTLKSNQQEQFLRFFAREKERILMKKIKETEQKKKNNGEIDQRVFEDPVITEEEKSSELGFGAFVLKELINFKSPNKLQFRWNLYVLKYGDFCASFVMEDHAYNTEQVNASISIALNNEKLIIFNREEQTEYQSY